MMKSVLNSIEFGLNYRTFTQSQNSTLCSSSAIYPRSLVIFSVKIMDRTRQKLIGNLQLQ